MKIKITKSIKQVIKFTMLIILSLSLSTNNMPIIVTASDAASEEITIDSLINDTLLEVKSVDFDNQYIERVPIDEEWNQLIQSDEPLKVKETYTESFDGDFFQMRLRPFTAVYNTPDVAPDATFEFVQDNGSKSVLMKTNGVKGGVYDYIEFTGMKYVEGATYSLTVNYTIITPNRGFKMGFGPTASVPYFMDLGGSSVGEKKSATAEFYANTDNGLGADIHAALILMVAGGDDPASIQIDSMSITRLNSKPVMRDFEIIGTPKVGETLKLNYEYYQESGIKEGDTEILWFTASDDTGANMSVISSMKGKKSLTITEDMSGYYVGAMVTPRTVKPEDNGIGYTKIITTRAPIGVLKTYQNVTISKLGESIFEDFEGIEESGNISFVPDEGVISYITDDTNMAIKGKSLVIKNPGPDQIKGGVFKGVNFTGGHNYVVSFKYKFIDKAPSNLFVQFRAPSQGYAADVNQKLASPLVGVEGIYESNPMTLGNFNDYFMQLFDGYGEYTVVIDDLKIQSTIAALPNPSTSAPRDTSALNVLATIGTPFTEDFTKMDIGQLWSYDNSHYRRINDEEAIDGVSLKQDFTNASFGGVYAFDTKGKLAAGGKYRLTVSYKYLTDTAPTGFYFGFTRDAAQNQKNKKIDFTGKQKNTVYTFTDDYILDDYSDYYLQWFNMDGRDGSKIVIDNLTLERVELTPAYAEETPSDDSTLADLAIVGKPFTENFTKGAIGDLWSFDTAHFSYAEGTEVIAGKSIKQDFTNASFGGIYAFGTKGKLTAGGKYRLTVSYKYLTDTAPTGFYFGFTRDGGVNQKNIQVDFTGKEKNTVYTFTADYTLDDFNDYYLQWFNLNGKDGSKIVIDTLIIERLDNPPPVVDPPVYDPETAADASTLDDLATVAKPFTENFTKNAIGSLFSFDASHFSVVEGAEAIAGKSIKQDFTNASFGGIYAFATKGKLTAAGKYRLTVSYKYLTDTAPTGFYFGFTRDGGENQKNIQVDFTDKLKNTVYTFTADYTLDDFNDYYLQWFNLNSKDGSKLVIDTLVIEQLDATPVYDPETAADASTLDDLATVAKPFTENFTKNAIGSLFSFDASHFSVVEGAEAIAGKSIKQDFTNASFGGIYAFDTKGKLTAAGKYRLTVSYKYLTDTAPTGFYFGFTRDGGENQKNIQVDFTDKQKNTVYTFTADYTLDDFNDYYLQWFNVNSKDGSKLVIDTLIIEQLYNPPPVVTLSDLVTVGKTFVEDFTKNNLVPNTMGAANVSATVISDANAISGNSLYINTAASVQIYFFETIDKLAPNSKYRIAFKYRILNAPENGAYGLPGLFLGMTLQGGGTTFLQVDLLDKTDGNIYTTADFEFDLADPAQYFPQLYINNASPLEIVIDDFSITRIN